MRRWVRSVIAGCVALTGLGMAPPTVHASDPYPPFIPPAADWLTTVNYYRAMSGLGPVSENSSWSQGAYNHSCYMIYNGIGHDEIPGYAGYTPDGDAAGNAGNVAVSSVYGTSARSHIELWMTGPFHAIGVLRHNLLSAGFGKCDINGTQIWKSGATLDVIRGLVSSPRPSTPTLFPGNGSTTNLDRFVTETPNPLTFCGWSGQAGLPVIAMMPEPVSSPNAWMSGPNGPIEVCVLSAGNTSGVASAILRNDNAVVVVPRTVLAPGQYSVTAATSARSVSWSFNVDPTAATGIQATPNASPIGDPGLLETMDPTRVIDSRYGIGAIWLAARKDTRIQIAGREGIPAGATAIVANVTATRTTAQGYITLWNCGAARPTVATINYQAGETMANAATIPLDASGGLCAYSLAVSDIIIDVVGYYSADGSSHYQSVTPRRLADSRKGEGIPGRMTPASIIELDVTDAIQTEGEVRAVALNLTAVDPTEPGFLTVYPCTDKRPLVSSLNHSIGGARANLVIAPVSERGTVCIYAKRSTDVVVDLVGWFDDQPSDGFMASVPFRFTDTREKWRTEMSGGNGGNRLASGQTIMIQIAGARGVPSDAKSVSANLTVVNAAGRGFLVAWPCGDRPVAANLNYAAGAATGNAALLPLSSTGAVCVMVSTAADVIIDVNGWWS